MLAHRPRRPAPLLILLAIMIGLAARPAAATAGPPADRPVTDSEARDVAEAIAKAVKEGDQAALDRVIDWNALLQKSTAGVEAAAGFRQGFILGLIQTQKSPKGFGGAVIGVAKKGGSYTLIHDHTKDQRRRLMFRLLQPEAGVNYHDLILFRRGDGTVGVEDFYVAMSGDLLSQTFRRLYVMAAAQQSGGLMGKLMGTDGKYAKFFTDLNEMNTAFQAGDGGKALAIFAKLPPELRKEKAVLLVRLQAAQLVGQAEYTRSIEEFRAEHPNDPCINLLSIDFFLLNKKYADSIACLDRTDKAVLGDPYLQTIRATIHAEMGQLDAARADAEKAIAAEPTLLPAYWSLITVALKAGDNAEVLRGLRLVRDRFQVKFGDLSAVAPYAGFVKSPQYREWLKDAPPAGRPGGTPGGN